MDLSSSAVTGYYGVYNSLLDDTIQYVGILSGRHTLITQQGTDPWTGDQLPLFPNGENVVVRLGNPAVGAETESLVYTFHGGSGLSHFTVEICSGHGGPPSS